MYEAPMKGGLQTKEEDEEVEEEEEEEEEHLEQ